MNTEPLALGPLLILPGAVYIAVGLLIVASAWVPLFIRSVPVSLPMLAVGLGYVLPLFGDTNDPLVQHQVLVAHVTEVTLLIAVIGAGLKIDRPIDLATWASTWRLLGLVMPLSIAATAALAHWVIGLDWALSILLGAILSPTDPVLASSVQSGPPGTGEESETRFALTSEAGLNDGLAMPFVILGVLLVEGQLNTGTAIGHWAAVDAVWGIFGGVLIGVAFGWLLVRLNRLLPEEKRLAGSNSGLVSVGLALLTYGLCHPLGANGFVGAFCLAVTLRNSVRSVDYSKRLNHSAEQIERLITMLVLVFFGFALAHGLLQGIGWWEILFGVLVLLAVRPVTVLLGFIGSKEDMQTRLALGFFGIRGLGSLYYGAFALQQSSLTPDHMLLSVTGLVVLMSVMFYGVTTELAMKTLEDTSDEPVSEGQGQRKP